jgi:hypothetical protein
MAKKTFTAAPTPRRPTAEEIAAFERGGSGHDRRPAAAAEPTKRLSLDLPASLHRRFKTACSATGRKMVGEIEAFIEHRTAELEDEAGLRRD